MSEEYRLERAHAFSQLFIQSEKNRRVLLIMANIAYEVLCSWGHNEIQRFIAALTETLTVGKTGIDGNLNFKGWEVS